MITVDTSQENAFATFTNGHDRWWPREFHIGVGLLATGAYLTNDTWTWGTPWIAVSVAGLVLVTLQGPLVAGPRAKALKGALEENHAGPLDLRARQLARDRTLWIVMFANPGVVLGITWNMSVKPETAEAIAAVLVGYALGAAAAGPAHEAALGR